MHADPLARCESQRYGRRFEPLRRHPQPVLLAAYSANVCVQRVRDARRNKVIGSAGVKFGELAKEPVFEPLEGNLDRFCANGRFLHLSRQ
jgi:hypothetical protein